MKAREPILPPFVPRNAHTVSVTLDDAVLARVRAFAERIEEANRKNKRRNAQGMTAKGKESLATRVMGLSGEAALAVYLGLEPVRIADEWRHRPDVLCFDCMTTDKAHGALIIQPRDRLDMMKVLVVDRSPVFHLCGWYGAGDARLEAERRHSEWWRTERERGGAWYTPQEFLRPLHDDEAQMALARHERFWTGDRYEHRDLSGAHPVDRVAIVHGHRTFPAPDGSDMLRPPDELIVYPDRPESWREVLRRAGAAPPEPKENSPSDRGP